VNTDISTFIPFSSLLESQQARVWAIADALTKKDCLPLVRFCGNQAPDVYDAIVQAVPERRVLISEYWSVFQEIPFISDFVLEA